MVTCVRKCLSTSRGRVFLRGPIQGNSVRNHDDEADGTAEIRWHEWCCSQDGFQVLGGPFLEGSAGLGSWLPATPHFEQICGDIYCQDMEKSNREPKMLPVARSN